jgi:hypothetical protein
MQIAAVQQAASFKTEIDPRQIIDGRPVKLPSLQRGLIPFLAQWDVTSTNAVLGFLWVSGLIS